MKNYDEEDKYNYNNRASVKRYSSVEAKNSSDVNKPFINENRSNNYTTSLQNNKNFHRDITNNNLNIQNDTHFPSSSPPPPYTEDGKLLPFASPQTESHIASKDGVSMPIYGHCSATAPTAPVLPVTHPYDSNKILPFATSANL
jgi:hypothetical protein